MYKGTRAYSWKTVLLIINIEDTKEQIRTEQKERIPIRDRALNINRERHAGFSVGNRESCLHNKYQCESKTLLVIMSYFSKQSVSRKLKTSCTNEQAGMLIPLVEENATLEPEQPPDLAGHNSAKATLTTVNYQQNGNQLLLSALGPHEL
jgi:hypothetical protein